MKKTDQIVQILLPEIENRQILEAACGRAEFTYSASDYAQSVSCIDLDDSKLSCAGRDNIHFEIMDAARMRFPDETFDTVFLYNALSHVYSQWEPIQKECRRVLKPHGSIYIVGTWKIDIVLMKDLFGGKVERHGDIYIVRLGKETS